MMMIQRILLNKQEQGKVMKWVVLLKKVIFYKQVPGHNLIVSFNLVPLKQYYLTG